MHDLTVGEFASRLNDDFTVSDGPSRWTLRLVEATARDRGRPGGRLPFTLLFQGPATPILPQAMYRFEHPSLPPLEIFIVPVGPESGAMRYEAIFS